MFTYRGSWCADGFRTSWEAGWRIVGERGSLIWDGFDELRAEVARPVREGLFDRVEPVVVPPLDASDRIGGHLGVIQDFVRAVESGTEPETRGADNIKSLGMVFARDRKRRDRAPGRHHAARTHDNAEPASRYPDRHHGAGQSR